MTKIILTPEHEKIIRETCAEFMDIGYSTKRIDPDDAKSAIINLYNANDLPAPKYVHFAQSPLEAEVLIYYLKDLDNYQLSEEILNGQFGSLINDIVTKLSFQNKYSDIRRNLKTNLLRSKSIITTIYGVFDFFCNGLDFDLRTYMNDNLEHILFHRFFNELSQNVSCTLGRALSYDEWADPDEDPHIFDEIPFLEEELSESSYDSIANRICANRLGMQFPKKYQIQLDAIYKVIKTCGWCYLYRDIAIICDKPMAISVGDDGVLHSLDGMAIKYTDGFGAYIIEGNNVDENVVMNPHEITREEIMNEENSEVRRIMIERSGFENSESD